TVVNAPRQATKPAVETRERSRCGLDFVFLPDREGDVQRRRSDNRPDKMQETLRFGTDLRTHALPEKKEHQNRCKESGHLLEATLEGQVVYRWDAPGDKIESYLAILTAKLAAFF